MEETNSLGGTQMVNKQPGNYLLSPYIQSRKQFLCGFGSQVFPCVLHFSVAHWECEAGVVLLSKSTRVFGIIYCVVGNAQSRIRWC